MDRWGDEPAVSAHEGGVHAEGAGTRQMLCGLHDIKATMFMFMVKTKYKHA